MLLPVCTYAVGILVRILHILHVLRTLCTLCTLRPGLLQVNRLRTFKSITLLQPLPPHDATSFDADHSLITVLGFKVAHASGLVNPRVPYDSVVQVIANDTEAGLAFFLDNKRVFEALGRRVDSVSLARKGYSTRLRLCLCAVDLVNVGGVFKARDFDSSNVLHSCQTK